ncbi:hypothetical protein A2U01_0043684, partial [Trifolium medium]|nr:hypothetical protein [Trifolium medium]
LEHLISRLCLIGTVSVEQLLPVEPELVLQLLQPFLRVVLGG